MFSRNLSESKCSVASCSGKKATITKGAEPPHLGVSVFAAEGSDRSTGFGDCHGTSGVNGVGKLMSSKSTMGYS